MASWQVKGWGEIKGSGIRNAILNAIELYQNEILTLSKALVRIPTIPTTTENVLSYSHRNCRK